MTISIPVIPTPETRVTVTPKMIEEIISKYDPTKGGYFKDCIMKGIFGEGHK